MNEPKHEGGPEVDNIAAASQEEQKELDIRRQAEEITDRAHELHSRLGMGRRLKEGASLLDATDSDWEEVPEEPYDREEAVQRTMNMIRAREDYHNRSMDLIVRDALSWIELGHKSEGNRYNLRHTLGREAWYVLHRAADEGAAEGVDGDLLGMLKKWACLELFSYHYYRDWDDMTVQEFKDFVAAAGIEEEEFLKLVNEPIGLDAEKFLDGSRHYEAVMSANEQAIEVRALKHAKEIKFEIGMVHNYGNFQAGMGI